MKSENLNRRPIVAAISASFIVLIFGLTYQILAARLLTPLSMTSINPTALDDFPLQIHDWTGHDIPMDDAEVILDQICAEASINRCYSRNNDMEFVSLFIAASGVTADTMVGHPPEICNVMSGYQLLDQRFVKLPLDSSSKLPCQILEFSRVKSLVTEKKAVLYYYVADGRFCGNRSQLRSQVRLGSNIVDCVGQVQIFASSNNTLDTDSLINIVSEFAVDSAFSIAELFERIQKDQNVDSPLMQKERDSRR